MNPNSSSFFYQQEIKIICNSKISYILILNISAYFEILWTIQWWNLPSPFHLYLTWSELMDKVCCFHYSVSLIDILSTILTHIFQQIEFIGTLQWAAIKLPLHLMSPTFWAPDEPFPPPDPLCTYSPLLTCRFSHCPYTWLARWLGITGISDILTSSTNSASLSCTQTRFLNSQYIGLPYSPHLYPWFVSLHILPIWSCSTF